MGPSNDQTPIALVSLVLLLVLVFFAIPEMLYLAIGWVQVYYLWYSVVFLGVSIGLVAWLLSDHDDTKPPQPRKIVRIT